LNDTRDRQDYKCVQLHGHWRVLCHFSRTHRVYSALP